jgi:hypothetical protein
MFWEYRVELLDDFEAKDDSLVRIGKDLNALGEDEWELVHLSPKSGKNKSYSVAILKRPKGA